MAYQSTIHGHIHKVLVLTQSDLSGQLTPQHVCSDHSITSLVSADLLERSPAVTRFRGSHSGFYAFGFPLLCPSFAAILIPGKDGLIHLFRFNIRFPLVTVEGCFVGSDDSGAVRVSVSGHDCCRAELAGKEVGWDSSQVLRRQRVLRKACEFSSHIGEHSLSMLSRILCTAPEPLAFAGRGAVEP
jgi:hypothetical protein